MNRGRLLVLSAAVLSLGAAVAWAAAGAASGSTASVTGPLPEGAPPLLTTPAVPQTPTPPPIYNGTLRPSDEGPGLALKHPKLASALVLLADTAARAEAAGQQLTANTPDEDLPPELRPWLETRLMRLTDAGEVQVYIIVDDISVDIRRALRALGARIELVDDEHGIVQAQVPIASLRQVADLTGVRKVRLPSYAFLRAGAEMTEGDAVMNADDVRAAFGVDGTGVTVGVISDGVGGLAASQASGDLPAVDTATCNTFGGDPGAANPDGTPRAEGTAMLEIIHDIAPGASLMFGNFGFDTALDFRNAVNCLAANADIVVDDIGFYGDGPYDGTSPVSQNTANALNGPGPIRGYYTSAGNDAQNHYQGAWNPSGVEACPAVFFPDCPEDIFWEPHQFTATAGPKGTKHARAADAPALFNRLDLSPDGRAEVVLVWDDPWGASGNDYDIFWGFDGGLPDWNARLCNSPQDGDDDPIEICAVHNNTDEPVLVDIYIGNLNGLAAPVTFDMFLLCDGCFDLGNGNILDFNTPGSSISNQADAGGAPASVVAVGAVPHDNPDTLELFSSLGNTEDGRLKPDIVAPDGVSVTGNGGFATPFFGTSAAAPHVAAVAALLLECDPALDRIRLRNVLLSNAVDLGNAGVDNFYGHGRVDALASAGKVCGAPTATPTPRGPTPTGPAPSPTPTPTRPPSRCPLALGFDGVFMDQLPGSLSIPDDWPNGVTDCINVSDTRFISDLNVAVEISHPWVGDLVVTLTHELTGTTVTLIDRPGAPPGILGCSESDIEATLDDEASSPVEEECDDGMPAILGSLRPNELLSAFDGEHMSGDWTIRIADMQGGDAGALERWSLVATLPGGEPGPTESIIEDVDAGDTVTTDSEGDGATPGDPIETRLTSPRAGTVSISEGPISEPDPPSFRLNGQQVEITAPPGTAADPIVLVFRIDASVAFEIIQVFRNGLLVPNCTGGPGTAVPDPCISDRTVLFDGDVEITILTSTASTWNFGEPVATGPMGDVGCDGVVNSIDAALVLQFNAGLIASLACQGSADVNGDGAVNSIDAALILQFSARLIDSLGPPPPAETPTPTPPSPPGPTATPPPPTPGPSSTPPSPPIGSCTDDSFEDNDTQQAAAAVSLPFSQTSLRACPDDDDWFSFSFSAGDHVQIDALFSNADGDIDIDLHDPSGTEVDRSISITDDEKITYTAATSGTYAVRVYLYEDTPDAGNAFTLQIGSSSAPLPPGPTSTPPSPPIGSCTDDSFEDNDTQQAAAAVSLPFSQVSLRACPDDDDWFSFSLSAGDEVQIDALFSDADGDIDIDLHDPSGTEVDSSISMTDDEKITYTAATSGTYAVRVYLYEGTPDAGNAYRLQIGASSTPLPPGPTSTPVIIVIEPLVAGLQFETSLPDGVLPAAPEPGWASRMRAWLSVLW